ncbi:hypothetical protein NDU88_003317 [Pleurodeles waltl]|uniref:Uncharacterized protein n=1 Tax=Pleurodeles waltl TaxID=8319 RepID=A0AAV7VDV1_PLEWA|nr:hypothetical protein NDU88_003317 [Pleurodeles waltl]
MDRRAGGRRPERRCTDSGKATPEAVGLLGHLKRRLVYTAVPKEKTVKDATFRNKASSSKVVHQVGAYCFSMPAQRLF